MSSTDELPVVNTSTGGAADTGGNAEPETDGPSGSGGAGVADDSADIGAGASDSVGVDDAGSADDPAVVVIDETLDQLDESTSDLGDDGVAGGCAENCSNDLRNVLNCAGTVTEACANGDACLDGVCVPDACAVADEKQSSIGCDYWTFKPDAHTRSSAVSCLAVFVANTWSVPVHFEVSRDGQMLDGSDFIRLPRGQGDTLTYEAYDAALGLPAGDVAILFLADQLDGLFSGCPVVPAVRSQTGVFGTDRGSGFNIRTTEPVSAYSVVPYGGGSGQTTSASLLLPTSRWGLEYVAVSAYPASQVPAVGRGVPTLNIMAQEDETQVSLLPRVAIDGVRYERSASGNPEPSAAPVIDPAAANSAVTYVLNRGEYLQISQPEELTGSPIVADKPIGVWGGSSCMSIPRDTDACDAAHQQIPPVQALGNEYVGVRYRNRAAAAGSEEAPPWRLVGAVDGTELSFEPALPPGAPTLLAAGEVAEFSHSGPFVVKSQGADFPFYFGQYMTGAKHLPGASSVADPLDLSGPPQEGDPEWVNVIPEAQYLKRYVFLTDPTYPETSLVVVRKSAAAGGFADVNLSCSGALTGWQAVGNYEFTRVDLVTGQFENVGNCSNGVQEMTSNGFFGVTVWGWGTETTSPPSGYVSYGYPAGAGLRRVNQIVLPPINAR